MIKDGNSRVIVTIGPKTQIKLLWLEEHTDLKKSAILSLAIDKLFETLKRSKE